MESSIFQSLIKNNRYTLSILGFGDDGKLGGLVESDNAVALRVKADSPYTVYFAWTRANIEEFSDFYRSGMQIRYSTSQELPGREKENHQSYIMERYSKYLQLPDNISPKVYTLVENIIIDSKNTNEKMWNIYEYLYNNFNYSTDVSAVPQGENFLDNFLFNEKKVAVPILLQQPPFFAGWPAYRQDM